jgi:hypothetical protein|tara:strand:+ start:520 stop:837 length:318 start_codon:yes stop_codon:yes gene_type:complete
MWPSKIFVSKWPYLTIKVILSKSQRMISGKILAQVLDKICKSPIGQNARVQIRLPRGEFHSPDGFFDVKEINVMENNILGQRETHRIVLELNTGVVQMGKPIKKL